MATKNDYFLNLSGNCLRYICYGIDSPEYVVLGVVGLDIANNAGACSNFLVRRRQVHATSLPGSRLGQVWIRLREERRDIVRVIVPFARVGFLLRRLSLLDIVDDIGPRSGCDP